MKSLQIILFLLTISVLLFSCTKLKFSLSKHDCEFIPDENSLDFYVDEKERFLMEMCDNDLLTTKRSIEKNLIGEWKLEGYAQGWYLGGQQPCIFLKFSESDLQIEYNDGKTDVVETLSWEVEEVEGSRGGRYVVLRTGPEVFRSLSLTRFCSEYMYHDGTSGDGDMYLYRKVY